MYFQIGRLVKSELKLDIYVCPRSFKILTRSLPAIKQKIARFDYLSTTSQCLMLSGKLDEAYELYQNSRSCSKVEMLGKN